MNWRICTSRCQSSGGLKLQPPAPAAPRGNALNIMGIEGEVETYDGYKCASEPRSFKTGGERQQVAGIIRNWIEETPGLEGFYRRCWDVVDQNGERYLLTCYQESDFWEINRAGD
ncbi:MAG: hypothetical protein JW738_07740 [Actinobacteria bacterium]|nr:hypothetical protein [Actinomycetota bacterium]